MTKSRILSSKPEFNGSAAQPGKQNQEKTVPFSLRLTLAEHAQLKRLSAGESMAAYARKRLFGENEAKRKTRGKFPVKDHEMLGRVLAKLGQSSLSAGFAELAQAAQSGSLPLTPETDALLRVAHQEVLDIKKLLMTALGIQER